jgi:putative ABC transport system permease protein
MSWLDGLRHKLRTVLRPGEYEREIREELQAHRELLTANSHQPIRQQTYHIEEARRMTWLSFLDTVRQDAGYAWRSIRRTPGVSAMIVITLALGIGVNGAVFNVLDQLYLRNPAGIENPEGLRRIWTRHTRTGGGPPIYSRAMSYPQFRIAAEHWGDTAKIAVTIQRSDLKLGGRRDGVSTNILFASANYFTVLGVRPARGRFFTAGEAQPGSNSNVLVVSHRYWQTALAGDESIIGRRIKLNTQDWEVIGVAPEGFDGIDMRADQTWAPLGGLLGQTGTQYETGSIWTSPRRITFHPIARLSPGQNTVDFERRVTAAMRDANKGFYGPQADTLSTLHVGGVIESRGPAAPRQEETIITRLQAVAFLVLLIAVANVVNLLLSRAVSRKREIAVRLALGISRARLIRLITIESVALAVLAAVAALAAAWWGGSLLRAMLMADITFVQPAIHAHVIWITLVSAIACGVVAGVIPAVQYSRPQLTHDLKDGNRGTGRQRSRLRNGLVMGQAALSVTLLVGAALLLRTMRNVEGLDIGFNANEVFYAQMAYDPGGAPPIQDRVARFAELEAQVKGRNGIAAVGRTAMLPMGGFSFWSFWFGSDSSHSLMKEEPVAYGVASTFFSAAGIPLLSGRVFDDGEAGASQVVVNEAFAKLIWPGEDAIGQCLRFDKNDAPCSTVVGVVATARRSEVIERPRPQFYIPLGTKRTEGWPATILVVRTAPGAREAAEREVSAMLKQALPMGYPVIRPMTEILEPKYRSYRLSAKLFTGVGILALLVALVGIYSTVSYSVGQRAHEFGVRMALGAHVKDVLNQVVGEGTRVVAMGIGIGVLLAALSTRLIASMLYGVEATDVSALILAAAILLLTAVVASAIPAWRASRADPVKALRGD